MADEPTTPAATATAVAEPAAERTVPYDRFKAVNDKLAEAQRKADEAEQKRQELEDRDKSELEQARSQLEKANKKITELSGEVDNLGGKLTENERKGWVRDAATKANFIDPTDAFARVDLGSIETREEAEAAIKIAAKDAKHLISTEVPPPPQIGQVLASGQPVQPGQQQAQDPNALRPEDEAFLAELKGAVAKGWSDSDISV